MWTYIFGAICPKKGKGAGLVLPYCDTSAMNQHLLEISRLENEADRIYRKEDATLFAKDSNDLLSLIKWRELYTWLEETVDACKDASQVVSEIVIKGS